MNSIPLLKQALGPEWNKLSPVIQRHYNLSCGHNTSCTVEGSMEVKFPWLLTPVIKFIHLLGGLVDIKGKQIATKVDKWVSADDQYLHWQRKLQKGEKKTVFASRMAYHGENELVEFIGYGLGLRLKISQQNGDLIYRSNGHLLKLFGIVIPIPDWLVLGHATITEQALSADRFRLTFIIRHPLWGVSYSYCGLFEIKEEPEPCS